MQQTRIFTDFSAQSHAPIPLSTPTLERTPPEALLQGERRAASYFKCQLLWNHNRKRCRSPRLLTHGNKGTNGITVETQLCSRKRSCMSETMNGAPCTWWEGLQWVSKPANMYLPLLHKSVKKKKNIKTDFVQADKSCFYDLPGFNCVFDSMEYIGWLISQSCSHLQPKAAPASWSAELHFSIIERRYRYYTAFSACLKSSLDDKKTRTSQSNLHNQAA